MIFITSYPYIGKRHRRVFDFFHKKDDLVFILPEVWKMKGGKVVMKAEGDSSLKIIPTKTYFFHSKYPVIRGQLKGWMPSTGKILKKMAKPGDVLYSVSEPNLLATYLNGRLAKKLGLKHIIFTWQNLPYGNRLSGSKLKMTEWLIRKNLSLSAGVICGNSKALEVLKPYMPAGCKYLVSPVSGMDMQKFRPGISSNFRTKYGLEGKTIILFVGAVDGRKGIFKMVDAFKAVHELNPAAHLFIVGSGPLDDKLKEYIKESGVSDHTNVVPWVDNDNLPEIFSNSDIFIYPSQRHEGWEEQFGYSIAEASSSGLPVVSTNTGSISDLIIQGETGILVNPEDTNGLKEALLKLSGDKSLRDKIGAAGRRFIADNFSHEIVAAKLENFLRSL